MKINILLLPFLLFLAACDKPIIVPSSTYDCNLTAPQTGAAHPQAEQFAALLDKALPYTTGVQVAVTSSDGATWTDARGFADLANNIPLEPCHRLMVASISKVTTAVLIMQAQEEGLLDIDDPLTDWLNNDLIGDLANSGEVSLRQLLNHTSGIPDYLTQEQTLNAFNNPFLLETQEEKLRYAYGLNADNAPGEAYSYSNTNYTLLGLVIEKVRGKGLADVVEEQYTVPLGLHHFAMGTEDNPIPEDVARPYLALTNGKFIDVTATAVSDAATGDGGIVSNLQDLNLWMEAVFAGEIISEASLAEMTRDFVLVGDQADFEEWPEEAYGLGFTRYTTPWGVALGHTGSTSSYNSTLFYFPESGVTFSIIANGVDLELIDELVDTNAEIRDGFLALLLE